jgi:hypothetical protein
MAIASLEPYNFKNKEAERQKQRSAHANITHGYDYRPEDHYHRCEIKITGTCFVAHFPDFTFIDNTLFSGFVGYFA